CARSPISTVVTRYFDVW
nr:immunoglobulin heavy chain junction region [Mus musculus]MBK4186566.1 immunoglobulin heavy chain junction region [Mus musculus]